MSTLATTRFGQVPGASLTANKGKLSSKLLRIYCLKVINVGLKTKLNRKRLSLSIRFKS